MELIVTFNRIVYGTLMDKPSQIRHGYDLWTSMALSKTSLQRVYRLRLYIMDQPYIQHHHIRRIISRTWNMQ